MSEGNQIAVQFVECVLSVKQPPFRLDPCPAEERVSDLYDVPQMYEPMPGRGTEGYVVGDDGIVRQKCGGGRRIIRKRIGGG